MPNGPWKKIADPALAKKYDKSKPLGRLIVNFHTYVEQSSGFVVDYAERHRYGKRVSTGFVEPAVNQVLAKRLVKWQRMQWTKKRAHLLVQARTKVLNREWESVFANSIRAFGHYRRNRCLWLLNPIAPHFLMLSSRLQSPRTTVAAGSATVMRGRGGRVLKACKWCRCSHVRSA